MVNIGSQVSSAIRTVALHEPEALVGWFGHDESSRIIDEFTMIGPGGSVDALDNHGRRWRLGRDTNVITGVDITDLWNYASSAAERASRSSVPKVPNIATFLQRCDDDLRVRAPGQSFAVFVVNLDRFRVVNDAFGHDVGNRLLARVGERLLSAGDGTRVGHLADDRFAVLLAPLRAPEQASIFAERLRRVLAQPFVEDDRTISLTCSIGIALAHDVAADGHPCDVDVLGRLRDAEVACRRSSESGGDRSTVFSDEIRAQVSRRITLDRAMRAGLATDEFYVVFQPKVTLATGLVCGAEALVRWNSASLGSVSPAEFIPVAEDSGIVIDIGERVLATACREGAAWEQVNPLARKLELNVNLSARQLALPDLVERISYIVGNSGLDPARLCLEITETAVVGDIDRAIELLHRLRGMGIRIALDDFGVGYSSLSYLQKIPADILKLDKSFIDGLRTDELTANLIRGVVNLGRDLGREIVAEGVEEEGQRRALMDLGCTMAQGYLFYRPLSSDQMTSIVEKLR
jgi:diguanylate cyclase (GGDEF)-like protein